MGVVLKETYGTRTVTAQKDFHLLKLVEPGDFVISLRSFEGGIEASHCRGIISPAYTVLVPSKQTKASYFARLFKSHGFIGSLSLFVTGIREGQNIDFAQLQRAYLPLPSPEEQRRIADYLDAATGKIDRLVALRRRQMELLHEQRAALIQQAVTRGLDPNVPRKKSIIPWVNQIPKHWKELRIAVAVTKNTNGFVGPTRDILVQDGVRYLQSLHLKSGEIRFDKPYYVTEEWSRAHSKSILQEGDVLVVQTGDIGQVAAVPEEFEGCNCHALIILRMRRAYGCGQYLALLFNAHLGKNALIRETTGALLPHLECGKIRDIRLPFPPPEEQDSILAFVQKENHRFDRLLSAYSRQIELLGEYRAALIHEAVTGQKAVLEEGVSAETGREANVHFRRSVLGAEIIHRLHDDAKFGRVKLEKLLYLSEAFAGMDLQGHYLRAAAGPFDNFALRSVESQIQRQGWYRSVKEDKRTRYVPLAKAGGHQTYFAEYWQEQKPKFEQLMELLRPATTQQCEIVATLFAAWNDRLAAGQKSDDDDLVDEVLKNWHPDKQKIERERWLIALGWMREHGLVPEGTRVITHGKSKGTGQRLVPEASADRAGNDP